MLLAVLCCLFAASWAQTADTVKTPPPARRGLDPDSGGKLPVVGSRECLLR